jgi:hypothetical protein
VLPLFTLNYYSKHQRWTLIDDELALRTALAKYKRDYAFLATSNPNTLSHHTLHPWNPAFEDFKLSNQNLKDLEITHLKYFPNENPLQIQNIHSKRASGIKVEQAPLNALRHSKYLVISDASSSDDDRDSPTCAREEDDIHHPYNFPTFNRTKYYQAQAEDAILMDNLDDYHRHFRCYREIEYARKINRKEHRQTMHNIHIRNLRYMQDNACESDDLNTRAINEQTRFTLKNQSDEERIRLRYYPYTPLDKFPDIFYASFTAAAPQPLCAHQFPTVSADYCSKCYDLKYPSQQPPLFCPLFPSIDNDEALPDMHIASQYFRNPQSAILPPSNLPHVTKSKVPLTFPPRPISPLSTPTIDPLCPHTPFPTQSFQFSASTSAEPIHGPPTIQHTDGKTYIDLTSLPCSACNVSNFPVSDPVTTVSYLPPATITPYNVAPVIATQTYSQFKKKSRSRKRPFHHHRYSSWTKIGNTSGLQ